MLQVHNDGKAVVSSGGRDEMERDASAMHSVRFVGDGEERRGRRMIRAFPRAGPSMAEAFRRTMSVDWLFEWMRSSEASWPT